MKVKVMQQQLQKQHHIAEIQKRTNVRRVDTAPLVIRHESIGKHEIKSILLSIIAQFQCCIRIGHAPITDKIKSHLTTNIMIFIFHCKINYCYNLLGARKNNSISSQRFKCQIENRKRLV